MTNVLILDACGMKMASIHFHDEHLVEMINRGWIVSDDYIIPNQRTLTISHQRIIDFLNEAA